MGDRKFDLYIVIGLSISIVSMFIAILLHGVPLTTYADLAAFLIAVVSPFGAAIVSVPFDYVKNLPKIFRILFSTEDTDYTELIETLVTFAEKSRREGLLSLENDIQDIKEPFLKKAIQLIVDGTDPEMVKRIMITEIEQMELRHLFNKKFFDEWGYYGPALGMAGALVGLIAALSHAEDRASVTHGVAIAFIATLYAVFISNAIVLPMATRLDLKNQRDVLVKTIMLEGVLSIQAGDNPTLTREKLTAFLPPKLREEILSKKEGG
ncbi:MAG: motility protein A [Brevinematia bacterium]